MKKVIFFSVFLILGLTSGAQKFSFLPEAGLLFSQIDGDKLNGFHKNGVIIGIGTHYALADQFNLGIKTSFFRQGSARRDPFQEKLPDGIQLEMGLSTVGLELSAMYSPLSKSLFLGAGIVHHQILDFDYNIVDNVISGPERILNPENVSSSFNNLKFFMGWSFYTSYRFTISYERSVNDILIEDFFNIARLRPYHMAFTLSYELNPVKKKKSTQKKRRGRK